MPYVAVDTSVSLPATLSAKGMARKLWLLFALGAIASQIEHHRLTLEELRAESEVTGALPGALVSIEAEAHTAERRRAALRDLLPHDTPEHWVAVGGAAIFDEYERKVREIGRRLNPNVRDTDVQQLRREAEAVCVAESPFFNPEDSPSFTRDRKDDPIVYTALLGRADYLISDDRDIVPDGSEQAYEHDEHQVLAATFNRFVTTYFEPTDLDWGAIDGRWLRYAFDDPGGRP
jgi:predicted nucleic acid-binding protein